VCEILAVLFGMVFLGVYGESILSGGGGATIQNVTAADGTTSMQVVGATAASGEVTERSWVYYVVAVLALIVAAVPLVLAIGVAWRAHVEQQAHAAAKAQSDGATSNDEEQGDEKETKKSQNKAQKKKAQKKKERAEAESEFEENPVVDDVQTE